MNLHRHTSCLLPLRFDPRIENFEKLFGAPLVQVPKPPHSWRRRTNQLPNVFGNSASRNSAAPELEKTSIPQSIDIPHAPDPHPSRFISERNRTEVSAPEGHGTRSAGHCDRLLRILLGTASQSPRCGRTVAGDVARASPRRIGRVQRSLAREPTPESTHRRRGANPYPIGRTGPLQGQWSRDSARLFNHTHPRPCRSMHRDPCCPHRCRQPGERRFGARVSTQRGGACGAWRCPV